MSIFRATNEWSSYKALRACPHNSQRFLATVRNVPINRLSEQILLGGWRRLLLSGGSASGRTLVVV